MTIPHTANQLLRKNNNPLLEPQLVQTDKKDTAPFGLYSCSTVFLHHFATKVRSSPSLSQNRNPISCDHATAAGGETKNVLKTGAMLLSVKTSSNACRNSRYVFKNVLLDSVETFKFWAPLSAIHHCSTTKTSLDSLYWILCSCLTTKRFSFNSAIFVHA